MVFSSKASGRISTPVIKGLKLRELCFVNIATVFVSNESIKIEVALNLTAFKMSLYNWRRMLIFDVLLPLQKI
jgi:hypothetical protein